MARLVHELGALDRPRLVEHYRALSPEDRRLRFGFALSEAYLVDYVERIDFARDHVFGIFGTAFELIGVAHMGRMGDTAELGLSVLEPYRREGLARRLVARALQRATALGRRELWIHFVQDNYAMARFTRELGMTIRVSQGEADAVMPLPAASPLAVGLDLYQCQLDGLLGSWRGLVQPASTAA
ncbi:MAG: GNAT family N-acetyltransferase [Gammaproteobacteria bacterium]